MDPYVYVGAASAVSDDRGGLFRRGAGDRRWTRLGKGLPEATQVQAITVHPTEPGVIFVGTWTGLYRSTDGGERWERLGFADAGLQVWSVLVHPTRPRTLYAGTAPVGVHRSDDGGDTWRHLPGAVLPDRVRMEFPCRVMRLAVDPSHPDEVYAAAEVGGVMRSLDGGDRWDDVSADLVKLAERPHLRSRIQSDTDTEGMLDGHALCVSAASPGEVILAVRMGLFRSVDRGASWDDMEVGRFSPLTYARDVRVSPHDPRTVYACLSPAARSRDGSLYRSPDLGRTWARVDHDVVAESTMMAVALSPRDPGWIDCATRTGQVFSTRDGGRTWEEHRLPDGVGDVYAIAAA
jgi:hypothetical protein